ncbi:jg12605 [Pararge aegeria aegeria]|uniref:Jg12605 protein n=1 Tax=Pararge aegeria aegeria TaxID=348720 RepID=A0A8S4SCN2_9NEOP|nr:jg12605 [Pararge aegeria aegeria]
MQLKWRWAGHIQRCQDSRWTKIVTNWHPMDWKRRPGRPLKRWEDDIAKVAGKTWSTLARDRCQWKNMEDAFTAAGGPYINVLN